MRAVITHLEVSEHPSIKERMATSKLRRERMKGKDSYRLVRLFEVYHLQPVYRANLM
jgi:hypothetical protein